MVWGYFKMYMKQIFCAHKGKVHIGENYYWCQTCDRVFAPKKLKEDKPLTEDTK